MSGFKIILSLLFLANLSQQINGVVFYEHKDHQGSYYRAPAGWQDGNKCNNMEGWFNDKASSVNTEGKCIIVYQNGDCNGSERRIFAGSCCHGNLVQIDMNDSISSYRGC